MDAASAALEVAPVRTMADLLEFMVACTVLTRNGDGDIGVTRYALNPHAALPAEVLPLSNDQKAAEDALRWSHLYEPIAQQIIGLFKPGESGQVDVIRTSLQSLAERLGADTETARAGLGELLQEPDFTSNCNPERILDHQIFEVRVDWPTFRQTRLPMRLTGPSSSE
jgi:Family of unknown function (DUF6042)